MASAQRRAAQRHNGLRRWLDKDDPKVEEAARDLRAAALVARVEKVVAEAPPLTDEQRLKIKMILDGGGDGSA